jgi:hypothetical protein
MRLHRSERLLVGHSGRSDIAGMHCIECGASVRFSETADAKL